MSTEVDIFTLGTQAARPDPNWTIVGHCGGEGENVPDHTLGRPILPLE